MNEHINDGAMYLVSHALMRDCDYCPYCGTGLSSNSMCGVHGRIADDAPTISTADRRAGNFAGTTMITADGARALATDENRVIDLLAKCEAKIRAVAARTENVRVEHIRRHESDDRIARMACVELDESGFETMLVSSWVEINGIDHDVWNIDISWEPQ